MTNTTGTVSADLIGKVARLRAYASGRRQRVLVDDVMPLDAVSCVIVGRLLYAANSTAYGEHDSRGHFSTTLYNLGSEVEIEGAK